jgi:dihydropteroate synthase
MKLKVRDRTIDFSQKRMVMGIININDDSFSGDGTLDQQKAIKMAKDHIANGADIIDVGAESARTNRGPISIEEEIERLRPFIESFHSIEWNGKTEKTLLSINTWRPEVVEKILPLGVDLLNDIGALHSNENAKLCAEHGTALLIMHSIGLPKEPHLGEKYEDIVAEVNRFFEEKIRVSESVGLHKERIVLDPGIDFAKDRQDNLLLLKHLNSLTIHQRPLLVPVSRKTVIGDVLKIKEPQDRDAGTVACSVTSILRGASILRVHNVSATSKAIRTLEPLLK